MKGKTKESNTKASNQLSFPDVTSYDHTKNCPRYTSVLNRADGDGVGIEEMDSLQMEIEALLVDAMQRTRNLKMELMILEEGSSDKNEIIKISTPIVKSASNVSLSINTPDKLPTMSKKLKTFPGKPASFSKNIKNVTDNMPIVRNDIPDTFWQSVEPYCADITEDDIKLMEHQIEIQNKYLSMPENIQPLGKHWTQQWAEDDLKQQIKDGSRLNDYQTSDSTPAKRKALDQSIDLSFKEEKYSMIQPLLDESFKKSIKKTNENLNLNQGPLTQRLISALIEQNLMTSFDNGLADYLDKLGPTPQPLYMSPKTMAFNMFSFNVNNSSLEKKLKKTLIEQKILDPDENEKLETDDDSKEVNTDTDEIAEEIKSLHNELKLVSNQCKQTLTDLLAKSKQSLVKQEVKKKINQLDDEIIECYQKLNVSRQVKKPLSKKEKEKATWLVQERKTLSNQLKNTL